MNKQITVVYATLNGTQGYVIFNNKTNEMLLEVSIGYNKKINLTVSNEMDMVVKSLKAGREVNETNYRVRHTDYFETPVFLMTLKEIYVRNNGLTTGQINKSLNGQMTITNNIHDTFKFIVDGEIYYGCMIPTRVPMLLGIVNFKGVLKPSEQNKDKTILDFDRSWYRGSWLTHKELPMETILKLEAGKDIYVTHENVLHPYLNYSKHAKGATNE